MITTLTDCCTNIEKNIDKEDQNRELFRTRSVSRMIELILTGLGNLDTRV